MTQRFLFFFTTLAAISLAQPSAIVSSGNDLHRPIRVAPGQILHLKLNNIRTRFTETQVSRKLPLEREFYGLSVLLTQSDDTSGMLLPLVRGDGQTPCGVLIPLLPGLQSRMVPCQDFSTENYDLVVQIPFELKTNPPGFTRFEDIANYSDAVLTLREAGLETSSIRILPVEDNVQFLNRCTGPLYEQPTCERLIYHADGKQVTVDNPARAGEEIIAYAYGLGKPSREVPSGGATPAGGIPLERPIRLMFTGSPVAEMTPRYVGLTEGQAGLYQVNFTVPALAPNAPQCTEDRPFNLTVYLKGTASSDQTSLCVRP